MRKIIIGIMCGSMIFLASLSAMGLVTTSSSTADVSLQIEIITGGKGVHATIRNNGKQNATNVEWSIKLTGGLVIIGKQAGGTLDRILPDKSTTVDIPFILGIGKTSITATAVCTEGSSDEQTIRACIRGIRVIILPGSSGALTASLERVAKGLKAPTLLTNAGDGSNRVFVAEQTGAIYIIENGNMLPTPFLDLSSKMVKVNSLYDERGLLGLVFHPSYESNGRFFVYYSAPKTGPGIDHEGIIAEYHVSADPNRADPTTEKVIYRFDEPEMNHNGGQLAFGPDGYFYIGLGDGGGAGDQHGDVGNGQNINTSLGKILRIDIDSGTPYKIPSDNPFVGINGLDEIYAYGFRNPYRFSFDYTTDRLFVADVGQDTWEEIDIVEKGGNYGWRILEGNHSYDLALADYLDTNLSTLKPPIFDYSHNVGHSVIGGFVYRGNESPNLKGKYIFGDWSTDFIRADGKLYYLNETTPGVWVRSEFLLKPDCPLKRFILGFGEDEQGEIYMLTTRTFGSFIRSGEVWHITTI
jgi:glucose/arabinose dehydrogenase